MTTTPIALDPARVAGWRTTWDAMMTSFVPGLAGLERVLGAAVEALRGAPPGRVLDLGGGPGLLAERMATRWPDATITLVDLDPVLLELARAGLPGTVGVVRADLAASWPAATGGAHDLITAVMTVHYLTPEAIRALYAAARDALAPGGLLVVADLMPDDGLPELMAALDPGPGEAAAELAWAQWWGELAAVPEFRHLMAARARLFRDRPPAAFTAGLNWHAATARAAGFGEAGALWREGRHAALAARR
ncbi:class I SAM-dependent methyltransferase [Actinoplanes teichomyceticus]|uniref:Methyltransferase family protein n=1 Tax=Actinoplanes teichomyceticus TaxID=1867 RepID=A0A561WB05_ACTTI|nr:class I SAM-dependent methyltransferase [Actinoplanes teichomyceticus]TWG21039.1 methyltransferase family protein [Actinoplanes teichomyceticus]GIF14859.1 methyltransferase [Actinoplanes teichomyceticus]